MPWVVFVLLAANIAVGGYFLIASAPSTIQSDVRGLEVNADKVELLPPTVAGTASQSRATPAAKPAVACLEWSGFAGAELERAQAALAGLGGPRTLMRESGAISLYIVEPSPALIARMADVRSGFPGTELRAVECPP